MILLYLEVQILPVELPKKFDDQDVKSLVRAFQPAIEKGPASITEFNSIIAKNAIAQKLTIQYPISAIKNRTKYEVCKRKQ